MAYVNLNTSLTSIGTNKYRATVTLGTSSSQVWNGYGQRVYIHVGSHKWLIGSATISGGTPSQRTFTADFDVSNNETVYASTICSYCEDGLHNDDRDKFITESNKVTATYTNPTPNINGAGTVTYTFSDNRYVTKTLRGVSCRVVPYRVNNTTTVNKLNVRYPAPSGTTEYRVEMEYLRDGIGWTGAGRNHILNSWIPISVSTTILEDFQLESADQYRNWGNEHLGDNQIWRSRGRAKNSKYNDSNAPSTNYMYFAVNNPPIINGNSLRVDTKIASTNVVLSWDHFEDTVASGNTKYYKIWYKVYANGSWSDYKQWRGMVTTNSVTIPISECCERGQKVAFYINGADDLEWGDKAGGIQVTRNSLPTFKTTTITSSVDSATYNKVFSGNVDLNIPPATDVDADQTIHYKIFYRKKANSSATYSSWAFLGVSYGTTYSVDAGAITQPNEFIQFGAIANDGLEDSHTTPAVTSYELRKNSKPATPSGLILVSSGHDNNDSYYEASTKITWNAVIADNGNPITNYRVKTFIASNSSFTGTVNTTTTTVTTNEMTFAIQNLVERGKYVRFQITAIDMYNQESDIYTSATFRRNSQPTNPTNFRCSTTKLNVYKSVTLAWDGSTDEDDNSTIYYKIWHRIGNGSYALLTSKTTQKTFTHDISSYAAGTTLGYKIRAYDKYDVASPNDVYINNCDNIVINTPPACPTLVAPKQSFIIYDPRPRILFNIPAETNNDNVTIYVTLNGTTYNSATSSSAFSSSSFASNSKMVFIPPKDLVTGANTISIKSYDGYQYSPETTYTINYAVKKLGELGPSSEQKITAAYYETLKGMIVDTLRAYNQTVSSTLTPTSNVTKIEAKYFSDLSNKIYGLNSWINTNYPGLNRNKTKPDIGTSKKITKDINNKLLDVITNL